MVTTLVEGSNDYCLDVEFRLRSKPCIGWNLGCGGTKPMFGNVPSEETRKKISAANIGQVQSQECVAKRVAHLIGVPLSEEHKAAISKKMTGREIPDTQRIAQSERFQKEPWNHGFACKHVWVRADEIYAYLQKFPTHRALKIANTLNLPKRGVESLLRKILRGWIPTSDTKWLSFKETYTKEASNAEPQPS